jgi:hypothetical protein
MEHEPWQKPFRTKIENLKHQLFLLMKASKTHEFKEELMQVVFHPDKIQKRLQSGLSFEQVFFME